MKLLALETSTENCSVALLNEDKISFKSELAPQHHAEIIIPMIDDLLKESSLTKNDLDGIVLSQGPGSFTGVRIAASTAQGLALGLDKKVVLVTSLEALAIEALADSNKTPDYVVSSIDARMGEVYLAVYKYVNNSLELLDEERVLKPEDAITLIKSLLKTDNYLLAGSGIAVLQKYGFDSDANVSADFPLAQFILGKGKELFEEGKTVDASQALPLYVRNGVTWKKVSEQHH